MKKANWAILPLLLSLGACSSPPAVGDDTPALLAAATPEAREELQRLVSEALGGADVVLSKEVLTRESALIIERNPPQDLRQRPLQGRNLESPEKFRLLLSGGRCWLERAKNGQRWELLKAECVPASG
ncbi:hypothetical protein OQJ68_12845 [Microbulbifer thermotolerans]|uniref:Lipoprotein n=1 Tax=Microbulbifer thermotolerans TaxID=252514 RepID=A0AB35HZB9_MICTH|nr:hypothetical protein [Microbulbifer thermotolerans]MCX2802675.1 hypothetical protein [Microbulbifer thermotolerans]